jgi:Methyltransferase domain
MVHVRKGKVAVRSLPAASGASARKSAAEIPVGTFDFGDLHRFEPVSWNYGFSRGAPIDRFYIERFLKRHRARIRGRVLEVEERTYTNQFGGKKVTHSDVLHVSPDHPSATVVADLTDAPQIPSNHYDCLVLTQTLQYIYDTRAVLRTLHRILRPGGTVLATFPGLSRTSDPLWSARWYWNFTSRSAKRLFGDVFNQAKLEVKGFGNLFVATAFLYGLVQTDIPEEDFMHNDDGFEITIGVCARK